jgi:hypothetical protein
MIRFHPVLKCGLRKIEVTRNKVTFYIPERQCTDMMGAIAIAHAVNPDVEVIEVIAGLQPDIEYLCPKRDKGAWTAIDLSHTRSIKRAKA